LSARTAGADAPAIVRRIRGAYETLRLRGRGGGFTTSQFDQMSFGEGLPQRNIDRRIRSAAAALNDFSRSKMTAADCAASVNLSPSRFLHLFKEQTGVSFRAFRAWKRARHLLHFVNEDINLAHLAQDIGYPDSTHFSHSIRRFYGLQPRAIFLGSRDLAIYRSDPAGLPSAGFRQGRA
jgi:AraC-like DNA-binding protein